MLDSMASPTLWWLTIAAAVVVLLAVDFVATRKLLEVSMREAVAWSAFAVPKVLQQRVLLSAIVGALVLRGIFIAAGADALERFDWVSLVFGAVLLLTGAKLLRDALAGHDHEVDINEMRVVRLVRRVMPVTEEYDGTRLVVRCEVRRWLTPLALVVFAVFAPRQAGAPPLWPRRDPGLHRRQAGVHWAHELGPWVPSVPTLASLGVILAILAVTTTTSLVAARRTAVVQEHADPEPTSQPDPQETWAQRGRSVPLRRCRPPQWQPAWPSWPS